MICLLVVARDGQQLMVVVPETSCEVVQRPGPATDRIIDRADSQAVSGGLCGGDANDLNSVTFRPDPIGQPLKATRSRLELL
jgi:hypothetical protein